MNPQIALAPRSRTREPAAARAERSATSLAVLVICLLYYLFQTSTNSSLLASAQSTSTLEPSSSSAIPTSSSSSSSLGTPLTSTSTMSSLQGLPSGGLGGLKRASQRRNPARQQQPRQQVGRSPSSSMASQQARENLRPEIREFANFSSTSDEQPMKLALGPQDQQRQLADSPAENNAEEQRRLAGTTNLAAEQEQQAGAFLPGGNSQDDRQLEENCEEGLAAGADDGQAAQRREQGNQSTLAGQSQQQQQEQRDRQRQEEQQQQQQLANMMTIDSFNQLVGGPGAGQPASEDFAAPANMLQQPTSEQSADPRPIATGEQVELVQEQEQQQQQSQQQAAATTGRPELSTEVSSINATAGSAFRDDNEQQQRQPIELQQPNGAAQREASQGAQATKTQQRLVMQPLAVQTSTQPPSSSAPSAGESGAKNSSQSAQFNSLSMRLDGMILNSRPRAKSGAASSTTISSVSESPSPFRSSDDGAQQTKDQQQVGRGNLATTRKGEKPKGVSLKSTLLGKQLQQAGRNQAEQTERALRQRVGELPNGANSKANLNSQNSLQANNQSPQRQGSSRRVPYSGVPFNSPVSMGQRSVPKGLSNKSGDQFASTRNTSTGPGEEPNQTGARSKIDKLQEHQQKADENASMMFASAVAPTTTTVGPTSVDGQNVQAAPAAEGQNRPSSVRASRLPNGDMLMSMISSNDGRERKLVLISSNTLNNLQQFAANDQNQSEQQALMMSDGEFENDSQNNASEPLQANWLSAATRSVLSGNPSAIVEAASASTTSGPQTQEATTTTAPSTGVPLTSTGVPQRTGGSSAESGPQTGAGTETSAQGIGLQRMEIRQQKQQQQEEQQQQQQQSKQAEAQRGSTDEQDNGGAQTSGGDTFREVSVLQPQVAATTARSITTTTSGGGAFVGKSKQNSVAQSSTRTKTSGPTSSGGAAATNGTRLVSGKKSGTSRTPSSTRPAVRAGKTNASSNNNRNDGATSTSSPIAERQTNGTTTARPAGQAGAAGGQSSMPPGGAKVVSLKQKKPKQQQQQITTLTPSGPSSSTKKKSSNNKSTGKQGRNKSTTKSGGSGAQQRTISRASQGLAGNETVRQSQPGDANQQPAQATTTQAPFFTARSVTNGQQFPSRTSPGQALNSRPPSNSSTGGKNVPFTGGNQKPSTAKNETTNSSLGRKTTPVSHTEVRGPQKEVARSYVSKSSEDPSSNSNPNWQSNWNPDSELDLNLDLDSESNSNSSTDSNSNWRSERSDEWDDLLPPGWQARRLRALAGDSRELDDLRSVVLGEPIVDYPILSEPPASSTFDCQTQGCPGGFFADVRSRCQVFHRCLENGRRATFLCPNGTIFSQQKFICDWWWDVDCGSSQIDFVLNNGLFCSTKQQAQES